MARSVATIALSWRGRPPSSIFLTQTELTRLQSLSIYPKLGCLSLCSYAQSEFPPEFSDLISEQYSKRGPFEPGLYLVATPIGNLEDITLRAIRVLRSANVVLSEDTRHSGRLLQYYNIKTPLLSYHRFNESQREQTVLKRLKEGEIVALISDAGTPGISDPGMELLLFLPRAWPPMSLHLLAFFLNMLNQGERLMVSANEVKTQIFYVPPHKLCQFLEETSSLFGYSRRCVIAREITNIHEERCSWSKH